MKNFVNTATAEYLDGEKIKSVHSNKVIIPFTNPQLHIWGETLCRKNCGKWMIEIYEKHTDTAVFRTSVIEKATQNCPSVCFGHHPI